MVLELEAAYQSDRNLIGGAADAGHLLHPAALVLVGGTLRQCRVGISQSGPGGHTDWVRGGGRGGAGGRGEGLAAVGLTQRFHLDQLIPDFRQKTQREKETISATAPYISFTISILPFHSRNA